MLHRAVEVRKEYMPDLVERLKRQRLRYQAFGAGLTRLVSACFPGVGIDALSDFRLTLTDLLVGDIDEEIAGIESKSYTPHSRPMKVAENMIMLNVASEFTKTPGPRFRTEGKFSGEEFREDVLRERFERALKESAKLQIDLDGGYGYATSFLEEAFGGLARIYDPALVLDTLLFKSSEEPYLIEDISSYIRRARGG